MTKLDATEIIRRTKEYYGHKKFGSDVYYKAPELYEISRQVQSLAEAMVEEINRVLEELENGTP